MKDGPENAPPPLRRRRDLWRGRSLPRRLVARVRRGALSARGLLCTLPSAREWVLFPYYHWVLDDEQEAFGRQLRFLRNYGDFISLDDAVAALESPSGVGGRYFCLTFDDGYRNWFTNAVPVLKELDVPAAFFVCTKYIGLDLDEDWEDIAPFYERSWSKYGRCFEFLDWDQCRQMATAGFTIGSHTHTHARLTTLKPAEVEQELSISKDAIEARLGCACRHFCCPWGRPARDFDPALHPMIARKLGYVSFLTTDEGPNFPGASPFAIRRNDVAPDQGRLLLRHSAFHR
jgi:peptidoglycan/xylan/chitin deacetylase (PgdA/CDA1 family)